MKIDRAEVERLAKIAARAERDQVAVRVDPGKLAELCRLALEVMDAPEAIMDTRDALGICAPTEEDFPALYALQGKRVRLVVAGEG